MKEGLSKSEMGIYSKNPALITQEEMPHLKGNLNTLK